MADAIVNVGGLQEVEVLKSVSYDRNVVQFYGTCVLGNQTMLVSEYMEVWRMFCGPG